MNTELSMSRRKKTPFIRRHIPMTVITVLFIITLGFSFVLRSSPELSRFFAFRVFDKVRIALGFVSSLLPFCLSELLIILFVAYLIFWLVFSMICLIKRLVKKEPLSKLSKNLLLIPVAILLTVGIIFNLSFCAGYFAPPVSEMMGIDTELTEDELFFTLDYLVAVINDSCSKLSFENGSAKLTKSFSQVADELVDCYDSLALRYPILSQKSFKAKPILLSPLMTYTHVSGIYTFFTGESTVNTNYPDYILPYTVSHEYSHQRGIAPENESNFLAFAACMESDDPFIRYSGAANAFSYIADDAYNIDKERYFEIISVLDNRLFDEYEAYREFFKKYENNPAADISSAANDAYLKANGQEEGIVSYSLVSSLISNYVCKEAK